MKEATGPRYASGVWEHRHDMGDDSRSRRLLAWFRREARNLPWRDTDAWGVMVSEYMLQQTPVSRVLPVWMQWRERWPTPASLAAATSGDAVRAWGRLGYPRRAQRLHAAAVMITEEFGGQVPCERDDLMRLPGIGDYTAAAIIAFAHGGHSVVLDTNIRRVLARAISGQALPAAHVTVAERELAAAQIPARQAPQWNAAIMELGALVCTARTPSCDKCPWREDCEWRSAGKPEFTGTVRRQARFEGSDRQARGAILALLREHERVSASAIEGCWSDAPQRGRALAGLLADGLVEQDSRNRFSLSLA